MSNIENDYCRRLLLLGGNIVDCEKELSDLRNILVDHKEGWSEWAKTELSDLQKTLERAKKEYAEMINFLDAPKH